MIKIAGECLELQRGQENKRKKEKMNYIKKK